MFSTESIPVLINRVDVAEVLYFDVHKTIL
jgi:hypothetical protein